MPSSTAGLAFGALAGFAASRTVGIFGFLERGLEPAPQALISLLVEVAALALLVVGALTRCTATRGLLPVRGPRSP